MNKAKYTPGPWKRNHLTVKDHRGMVVAEIAPPDRRLSAEEKKDDMEWCKGNASLISAAPDLERIVTLLVANGLSMTLIKEAQAALDKAAGKTK